MVAALAVWQYGVKVARIEQERGRLRLSYTNDALDRFPLGAPLLSLSMPLTANRYGHGLVRPFLDGLLPEGDARRAVAADLDILASDTFGLVRDLGRDCAGALVIQPDDDPPPPRPSTRTAEPLTETEVAELVANLRAAPLGVGARVRLSLAGMQEKLLLTLMPDGSWGRPVDGTPSTHIIKPEIAGYPDTVENEAFCMRLAEQLELPVAHVETTSVGNRKVIVVQRYDRVIAPDGAVERIHQEDLCQATGIPPDKKYEQDGGPSLHRVAGVLQAAAGPDALHTLLRATALNVIVGNGDAHGKNFSLLHQPSGAVELAPLYDVMSTLTYGLDRLAMYVDNVHRVDRVSADRLLSEAERWGLARRVAAAIVTDLLDRTPAAIEAAREHTPDVPSKILALIASQLTLLRGSSAGTGDLSP